MQSFIISCLLFIWFGRHYPDSQEPANINLTFGRIACEPIVNQTKPVLDWKQSYIQKEIAGSITPVLTEDMVIVSRGSDFNPPEEVFGLDKKTGDIRWSWNDYFSIDEILFDPLYYNKNMVYISTYGNLYAINSLTGSTFYRKDFGHRGRSGVRGQDDLISFSYNTDTTYEVVVCDVNNMNVINCISKPRSNEFTASLTVPVFNNKSIYVAYNSYHFEKKEYYPELYRVDLINGEPIIRWSKVNFDTRETGKFGIKIFGNKLYVLGRGLYCLNLNDGSTIWHKPDIIGGPAGLLIADYKLIVATNHLGPSLVALDLDTGGVIWEELLSGTASPLQFHSCVIYTVGGGDGLLHAVDVSSGRHLYKMESPDVHINSDLYFNNCTVDKEENSIYLTNFKYVMKYRLPDY